MSRQALDIFASELDATVLQAIDIGARSGVEKRLATLTQDYEDPDALRRLAGQLRQHSLDHLDEYLTGAERRLKENGAQVHFAATTARALEIVLDIVRASGTRVVTKSKSMASEELDLSRDEILTIGRDPSNDLVLPDAMVSRRHAVVEQRGSQFFLRDCNSANGSVVNGDRVSERGLRDGDLVTVDGHLGIVTVGPPELDLEFGHMLGRPETKP